LDWDIEHADGSIEDFDIELWDTAGQEALKCLRNLAYPDTNIFLLGFKMWDMNGLENILGFEVTAEECAQTREEGEPRDWFVDQIDGGWIQEITEGCESDFEVLLVGTQQDRWEEKLAGGEQDIPTLEQMKMVAYAIGARGLVCTSSKTGYGLGTEQADGNLPEEGKPTINSRSTLLLCLLTWTAVLSLLCVQTH